MPSLCVASHVAALRPHNLSSRARIRPVARAPRNRDTRRRSAPAVKFGTAAAAGSRPSRVPDRRPASHDDLIRVDDDASDVRRLRGNCYGCGVALQTERADVSGYVDPDEYETKRVHKQLFGMMLCARCGDLSNGAMVNAVAGQAARACPRGSSPPRSCGSSSRTSATRRCSWSRSSTSPIFTDPSSTASATSSAPTRSSSCSPSATCYRTGPTWRSSRSGRDGRWRCGAGSRSRESNASRAKRRRRG